MSRTALLDSAITFLRDPSTSTSSLAQRIAFLESKGLTPAEIESALLRAQSQTPSRAMMMQQGQGQYARQFERDWRDWFIMGVVGGTVGYVAVKLVKKYLLPHLQPPSTTDLSLAEAALTAKYDEASLLLSSLRLSTDGIIADLEEQKTEVGKLVEEVRKVLESVKEGEERREESVRGLREGVMSVKEGLPNMLEKQAASHTQTYNDLSTELRSLKSLLVARRPSSTVPVPVPAPSTTTPLAATTPSFEPASASASRNSMFPPRAPGIPAWQLKGAAPAKEKEKEKEEGPEVKSVSMGSESVVLVERPEAPAQVGGETAEQKSEETEA